MLRNLIMGLLLANVLLLAWGRWIVAPDVAEPTAFGDEIETELILIEQPRRPDSVSGMAGAGGARCFRLGPFSTADAAAAVGNQLSARGIPVARTRESGRIWVGHWVQVLELPDVGAAHQAVTRLVSGGISDAYISGREPTVDVSLGVFRSRRGADERIRLARNLGYSAVATDRYRDGTEHWVEATTPADQPPDLDDLRLAGSTSGQAQIVRIEERSCSLAAAVIDSIESPPRENGSPESQASPE